MQAKKSYGQHFLTNEHYAQRIAEALQLAGPATPVLEVGPGRGMLTKYLLGQPYALTVVEADPDMVQHLEAHFPALHGHIISADFLRVHLEDYFPGEFVIIGNFPYNISSQILIKMIEYRQQVPELVGMFQKEVAERVAAPPGSKTYGVISVLVQAWYEVTYLFAVGPGNFNPPPKVQSAVIRAQRLDNPLVADADAALFKQVVKMAFGQRRKMLRNTMKPLLGDDPRLNDPFFTQRPEQLGIAEFVQLTAWVRERQLA